MPILLPPASPLTVAQKRCFIVTATPVTRRHRRRGGGLIVQDSRRRGKTRLWQQSSSFSRTSTTASRTIMKFIASSMAIVSGGRSSIGWLRYSFIVWLTVTAAIANLTITAKAVSIKNSILTLQQRNRVVPPNLSFDRIITRGGNVIDPDHNSAMIGAVAVDAMPKVPASLMASCRRNRNAFLTSLLQVRGGDNNNFDHASGFDFDDVDDGVSAEDLLDSIFSIDDDEKSTQLKSKPKQQRGQRERMGQRRRASQAQAASRPKSNKRAKGKGPPSTKGAAYHSTVSKDAHVMNKDADKRQIGNDNVHAFWGPNVANNKHDSQASTPVNPSSTPTTNEAKVADNEIIRAREHKKRICDERHRILSRLAHNLHDTHVSTVHQLIKGGAAHVPPELFGQTIAQEKSACDEKFHVEEDSSMFSTSNDVNNLRRNLRAELESTLSGAAGSDEDMDDNELEDPNAPAFHHIEDPALLSHWGLTPAAKLYGGAQYHRVLRYYHHLFLTSPLPPTSDDEVAILTNGISEVHDASDLMRAAALIVRRKMERVMEEVLADMTRRVVYVIERMWDMVGYSMTLHRPLGRRGAGGNNRSSPAGFNWYDSSALPSELELYRKYETECGNAEVDLKDVLATTFRKFAEERAAQAYEESLEDVRSLLRYVTWDMGRARKRKQQPSDNKDTRTQNHHAQQQRRGDKGTWENNGGFISQIEIVSEDNGHEFRNSERSTNAKVSKRKKVQRDNKKVTQETVGRANRRMVARGGGGHHRNRRDRHEQSHYNNDDHQEEDEGDLIGGVMNRGSVNQSTSLVLSSTSSPLFSGDDEVLNVLLDTLSSSLVTNPDARGSHTRAAIESLVAYMCDRTRTDISRIVRSKFNVRLLMPFYEDLGAVLRKEVEAYLAKAAAAAEYDHGLD